jgi:HD-like signal output (HDOD) protein
LRVHLQLVYEVGLEIVVAIDCLWPDLPYDREAICIGAATHDIGKAVHQQELTGPGQRHEDSGPWLLRHHGFPEEYARFARTHAQWHKEPNPTLEDLLAALADTIWKGKRDERKVARDA